MEILAVKNLSYTYPLCGEKAIDDLSFSVESGDFVAVCGATGSGKTTLLRMLKRELTPLGDISGEIRYFGKPYSSMSDSESARRIGYVMQKPEQQIVADKVYGELAFGLENMGLKNDVIRRRVSETACWFGIEDWFEKNTSDLSGGQMQLLNLASVMVMQPDILLLDEPTAQLDPIASSDFISAVSRLNRELSLTVIIVEHDLEEVISVSDKLLALDGGRLSVYGNTRDAVTFLSKDQRALWGMPAAVRLYARVGAKCDCPLTVREGRSFIEENFGNAKLSLPIPEYVPGDDAALEFQDVFFRYSRELPDVLRGLDLRVYSGELFCLLGGNGSGKSTTLSVAAALQSPYSGTVKVFGKKIKDYKNQSLYKNCLSMLPQDVGTMFLCNTVSEELADAKTDAGLLPFDFSQLYSKHPYDLSGGQMQLLALAKALSSKPRLLLLDEPTKGLDASTKENFISVLLKLKASGMTIVAVTHDVEFAASCADRCAMLFRGEITSCDVPRRFFAGNNFYTTAANRMTRGYYENVATVDDAEKICLANERRNEK